MSKGRSATATSFHARLATALAKASPQDRERVLEAYEIKAIYESCHGELNKTDRENMKASDHCDKTTPGAKKGTGRCLICEAGAHLLLRVGDRGKYRIASSGGSAIPSPIQVGDQTPSAVLVDPLPSNLATSQSGEVIGRDHLAGEISALEGRDLMRLHRVRERKRGLVKRKKQSVLSECGRLACEVCGFDFAATYGLLGEGFAECHHDRPLSSTGERITRLSELSVVCANCHRMLHRQPWRSVADLRVLVQSRSECVASNAKVLTPATP